MSNRLPSLGPSGSKPGLKFKPKVVARKSKEEREASVLKLNEDNNRQIQSRQKYTKKYDNQQKKRIPKYLNNTRIITSGPLAAGNFSGGGGDRGGFIKMEGSNSKLLQQGLKAANDGDGLEFDSDDGKDTNKINMGREYTQSDIKEEDSELENNIQTDEEKLQSQLIADMFPLRAIRIKHEDTNGFKKIEQDSSSDKPITDLSFELPKLEENLSVSNNILDHLSDDLEVKLDHLKLKKEFCPIDSKEALEEIQLLHNDHQFIAKKLNKIHNIPNKFIFLQLPMQLPKFKETKPVNTSEDEIKFGDKETSVPNEDSENNNQETSATINSIKDLELPESLTGNIGSLRIHKSGKITVKIGNVIMGICRGADTSFLQDVIALDKEGEEIEMLGQIEGRVVVTPRF